MSTIRFHSPKPEEKTPAVEPSAICKQYLKIINDKFESAPNTYDRQDEDIVGYFQRLPDALAGILERAMGNNLSVNDLVYVLKMLQANDHFYDTLSIVYESYGNYYPKNLESAISIIDKSHLDFIQKLAAIKKGLR